MDLIRNSGAVKLVLSPSFRLNRSKMRFKASAITALTGQLPLLFRAQPIMHLGQRIAPSKQNHSSTRETSLPLKAFVESKLTQIPQAITIWKLQLLLPRKHKDLDQTRPWKHRMSRRNLLGKFKGSRRTTYRTLMHRSLNILWTSKDFKLWTMPTCHSSSNSYFRIMATSKAICTSGNLSTWSTKAAPH